MVEFVEELTTATSDACNAGDAVTLLLQDPDDEHSREPIGAAITNALNARAAAQRIARSLAQLTLGVTSQLGWNDAIALAERAAVMVLHPPEERVVSLVEDGLVFHARHDPELRTELCGALCRMIIDHNCVLELRTAGAPGCRIALAVDAVGNLAATMTADPADLDELVELGWEPADEDGELRASWDDPMTVVEPAGLVLGTLQRLAVPPIAAKLEVTMTAEAQGSWFGDGEQ